MSLIEQFSNQIIDNLINSGNQIIFNLDGTISIFTPNGSGGLKPYFIQKFYCEYLHPNFYYDSENQTCRYAQPIDTVCDITNGFKVIINSNENDGSLFEFTNNDNCFLDINFNYLFKLDCQSFIDNLTNNFENCTTPSQILETLNVDVTIDVLSSTTIGDKYITVYEDTLFTPIGNGLLYNYLTKTQDYSGFHICGSDSQQNTGCTSVDIFGKNPLNCNIPINNLVDTLFLQSGLSGLTNGFDLFKTSLNNKVFNSNWLNYSFRISDESILSEINGKKIKLTIKVNNSCSNICVLLDDIKLNKTCNVLESTNIKLEKPFGFDIIKVVDNKKSWVTNSNTTNRNFSIMNLSTNKFIRETDYNLNDSRLIINTKEIDLNVNGAKAIETDVMCYINNNPCLLTGKTCDGEIYGCNEGYTLTSDSYYCVKTITTGGTAFSQTYTAATAAPSIIYCSGGTNFYENIDNLILPLGDAGNFGPIREDNGSGSPVLILENVISNLWGDYPATSPSKGRLNFAGLSGNPAADANEFIGFSFCIDVPETKVYSLGIAGDDYVRLKLNGNLIVNLDAWRANFYNWHVFPITLVSGLNIIELEGANFNTLPAFSFAAEIYDTTPDILSGLTTQSQLNEYILFTTADKSGTEFNSISCPSGFSVNSCDGEITCTKIERIPSIPLGCCDITRCGDDDIEIDKLTTTLLSGITDINEFISVLQTELIDVRNRKTLQSYPTLRLLYDRYINSSGLCADTSNSITYDTINNFADMIGTYWSDLIEQVIPATTIWGSTRVYSNTIFDSQKFQYKRYSLLIGNNPFIRNKNPNPNSATTSVDVITTVLGSEDPLISNYDTVYMEQFSSGSEFIGTISIIGSDDTEQDEVGDDDDGDIIVIEEPSLPIVITTVVSNLQTLPVGNTADSGGEVSNDGGSPVIQRGVCWSTNPSPTTSDSNTLNGTGIGVFNSQLTGLVLGQTYYVRAYAINSAGTAYGNQVTIFVPLHYIGEKFGGGFIYYLNQDGLTGYICAENDLGSLAPFAPSTTPPTSLVTCDNYDITLDGYSTSTNFGSGQSNSTNLIDFYSINDCNPSGVAVTLTENYSVGGYSDWFLPSRDDLSTMYTNLNNVPLVGALDSYFNFGVSGGFTDTYYVSSSQNNANSYWIWDFNTNTGTATGIFKNESYKVRPIRMF
jgi:hypothetical protein